MSGLEVTMMKRIGELKAEIEALQAEVERLTKAHSDALGDFWAIHKGYFDLKAEVERLRASSFVTAVPVEEYEKLKAEVERLRKAGDAMYEELGNFGMTWTFREAWNAAKEGKPSV